MRCVADTNTVVSGTFWWGPPRRVLDSTFVQELQLFTSPELLAEFADVLARDKWQQRVQRSARSITMIVRNYSMVATVIEPLPLPVRVAADPDGDAVLACAVMADAEVVVSGDRHLLSLGSYRGIEIVTAADLLARLAT